MAILSKQVRPGLWVGAAMLVALLILLAWRCVMPAPPMDARGVANWIEISFLLVLYVYVNLASLGMGWFIFRRMALLRLTRFESVLLSYLLGFGVISLIVMALGFAGLLTARVIFLVLVLVGIVALSEWPRGGFAGWRVGIPQTRNPYVILLHLIGLAAIPLLLVESFSPVWDYDALLYHLEVPRRYLAQAGIFFDPEILRSVYPYGGEMLFVIGMVFDLDPFAKLVNLTFAVLFLLSTYAFCRRFFGRQTAYTAAGILLGAPAFWMWSTWAAVDFAWGVYEFWSVYAVMLWWKSNKADTPKWLAVAGLMSGFAAGIKYLSIPALLIMAVIIAWKSMSGSPYSVREALKNAGMFGVWAVLAGGAWYIHNWYVTGNPVYPLVFGGPGWDPLESQVLSDYVGSFGVGKNWIDFLFLPINVYVEHRHFSTINIELIHPALWLAVFAPFVRNWRRSHDLLIVYALLGFCIWAAGSQVIRFLIPLTAVLAILAGAVIESLRPVHKRLCQFILVGGCMLFNLIFQFQWLLDEDAWQYVSGRESAVEFLQNMSFGYETIRFIQTNLNADQKAQFLWDGRGYYCDARCTADDEQSNAIVFANGSPLPADLAADLRSDGITHLVLSEPNVGWFILYHDPQQMHGAARIYFDEIFFPACGRLVHKGRDGSRLYEITCGGS